jgi:hypothetical protein
MGILDEAIREHLELKRQHGADDSELKQLEDDAFGPPERPGASEPSDTASEAATEFMQQPDVGAGGDRAEAEAQAAVEMPQAPPSAVRREPVADVQEAPGPAEEKPSSDEEPDETPAPEAPEGERPDEGPAEEEQPAEEHEAVTSPPPPAGHTTAERHAIADQPTEMYDVEEEFGAPAAETGSTSDEDLAAEEETEPRLGPAEPIAEPDLEDEEEEEDDFFDEKRLSDELDQALEAPAEPDSEEYEKPEPPAAREEDAGEEDEDEDLLEDTPDFLEESPEDDELWFEQKPPKDFDFDD